MIKIPSVEQTDKEMEEEMDEYSRLRKMAIYCMHCGFCRALTYSEMYRPDEFKFWNSCPSGTKFFFESYFSPGRNELARAVFGNEFNLKDSEKLLEVAYACTLCGQCQLICHFETSLGRVKSTEIFEGLRRKLYEEGIGPLPNQQKFIDSYKENHNPYQEPHNKRLEWLTSKIKTNPNSENLYFVGCTSSYRTQNIAKSSALLLNKAGIDFRVLGGEEWCCGSPLMRVGARDIATEAMKHDYDAIKKLGINRIIFSCPGCLRTFKVEYPDLVGSLEPDIELIHVTQYLADLIEQGKIKFNKYKGENPVTYHDPCHMGRQMYLHGLKPIYEEPRSLLKSIPGLDFIEMYRYKDYAWCCGAGGGVKSGFPEMAMDTAKIRIDEAMDVKAKAIVSACPFCYRNLQDAIDDKKADIKMYDIVELLLEHIEGGK